MKYAWTLVWLVLSNMWIMAWCPCLVKWKCMQLKKKSETLEEFVQGHASSLACFSLGVALFPIVALAWVFIKIGERI